MPLPDIGLTNQAKNISADDFANVFREKFPRIDTFKEFYLSNNGGYLEKKMTRGDFNETFRDFIIFGTDNSGNLWSVKIDDGSIYFMPRDTGPDLDAKKREIAKGFREFLGLLDYLDNVV